MPRLVAVRLVKSAVVGQVGFLGTRAVLARWWSERVGRVDSGAKSLGQGGTAVELLLMRRSLLEVSWGRVGGAWEAARAMAGKMAAARPWRQVAVAGWGAVAGWAAADWGGRVRWAGAVHLGTAA